MKITFERANELLDYCPETGKFTWVGDRPNQVKAGSQAGYTRRDGYLVLVLDCRHYLGHRVAWLMAKGNWPSSMIDHIDGDPRNNRLSNLRPATRAQNMMNMALLESNTSGFKGVSWDKSCGKYQAYITVDRRKKSLGFFSDKMLAAAARHAAEKKYFGEYSTSARAIS